MSPEHVHQSIEGALPRPSGSWAQRASKAATLPRAFSALASRRAFSSAPFVSRPLKTLEHASPLWRRGVATAACFIFIVFPVGAAVQPPVLSRAGVPSRHPVPGWVRHRLSFLLSGRHLLIGVLNTKIEIERVEQWPTIHPNPPCIFHRHNVNEDLINHTMSWLRGPQPMDDDLGGGMAVAVCVKHREAEGGGEWMTT
jgi:hypothetical protein